MAEDSVIETGVDKLLKLIERKTKLTIEEAAKTLGVSTNVIQEWADFLEEEGIVSIEYTLTHTYLVEKKMTRKEIETKAKDFKGKKDGFIRKVEGSIQAIENDTAGLDKVKKEFSELQIMVSSEIDKIKDKLSQLQKYEGLKKNLDRQIFDQHREFKDKISKLDKEIFTAQKSYQDIINDIRSENTKLEEEKIKAESLKGQEDKLLEKIGLIEEIIKKLKSQIKDENSMVGDSESHIIKLQRIATETTENIGKKRDKLKYLIDESKEKEQMILKLQGEVLDEIKKKEEFIKKDMVHTDDVTKHFENFFKKKNEINALLDKITIDRDNLKHELNGIIKSAIAFELSAKSNNVKGQISEIEKKFSDLDKKRGIFKKEIEHLKKIITS